MDRNLSFMKRYNFFLNMQLNALPSWKTLATISKLRNYSKVWEKLLYFNNIQDDQYCTTKHQIIEARGISGWGKRLGKRNLIVTFTTILLSEPNFWVILIPEKTDFSQTIIFFFPYSSCKFTKGVHGKLEVVKIKKKLINHF